MKKMFLAWSKPGLVKRIIIGLIFGIILALLIPSVTAISLLGTLFVGALKGIAPLLVLFLIISALSRMAKGQKTNMTFIVVLYMVGNLVSAAAAVAASYIFPVTLALGESAQDMTPPSGISEVMKNLLSNLVANPVTALMNANYIGILFWAIIFGLALRKASDGTKEFLDNVADCMTTAVQWVIGFAPLGILGIIFGTVSEHGLGALASYGKLLAVLVGSMLVVAVVINPIIVYIFARRNPYPLVFTCLKESGITAFFTRSSAANIPVNMELCRRLELDEDTYSISIPLGATVNMAGAAITISVMALAAANTVDIKVDFLTAMVLCVLAAVSAAGASGVAGGSLLLIPMACGLFGVPSDIAMQVVGVGFIVGVVQDSCETALNSSTDVLYTAVAEYREKRLAAGKGAKQRRA